MKSVLSLVLLVCAHLNSYAQAAKVVACDLATQPVAEAVLGSPIAQHSPNREVQQAEGGAWSTCVFFAKRSTLIVNLFEYKSVADAKGAFTSQLAGSAQATQSPVRGVGDEGVWLVIGREAMAYKVRKGKYVLDFTTQWKDSAVADSIRDRLVSPVKAAAGRL